MSTHRQVVLSLPFLLALAPGCRNASPAAILQACMPGAWGSPPVLLAEARLPETGSPTALAVVGSHALLATSAGKVANLYTVDLAPREGGLAWRRIPLSVPVHAIAVIDKRVFLGSSDASAELQILHVGPTGIAWPISYLDLPGAPRIRSMLGHDTRLYVGTAADPDRGELWVVDTKTRPKPGDVESYEIGQDVDRIDVRDSVVSLRLPTATLELDLLHGDEALRFPHERKLSPAARPDEPSGLLLAEDVSPLRYAVSRSGSDALVFSVLQLGSGLTIDDVNGDGGVVLACLGDSNTFSESSRAPRWCEYLDELVLEESFSVENFARPGTTAVESDVGSAFDQFPKALTARADAIVFAFGTNDTSLTIRAEPDRVVDAYEELHSAATERGLRAFVALTPPRYNFSDEQIREINAKLRERLPAEDLLDFYGIVDATDFAIDGYHLKESGQHKRAREAHRALTRPRPCADELGRVAVPAGFVLAAGLLLLALYRIAAARRASKPPRPE